MRKTLSLVLAVLMVLALLPAMKLHTAVADTTMVTDTLTRDTTGITGTTYGEWSGKSGDSGTVYAGQSAGGNDSIQLRSNNSNSGIINTASVGNVRKIVVTWNTNTAADRQLDIYGSNSAFSAPTALYNSSTQGTKLGSIVKGTSTELNITDNYAFIGMRSNSGAMYIDKIEITWEVGGTVEPPSTYTVTLNPGDGEGEAVTVEDVTSPYTLPNCPATFTAPDGKVFAGWKKDGDDTLYAVGASVTLTEAVTFIAQWEDAPVYTNMELKTELADGDEIVIYYPDSSKIVTGEDYFFNNTKHELVAADAALTDGVLAVPEAALVLTVSTTVADDEETTLYTFKTADDKYLYADATDVKLVDAQGENTLFRLETAENGFYIKCNTAADANSNAIYIEYYKGYFTSFKMGTAAKYYTFQFFAEPEEVPPEPPTPNECDVVILFTNDVHCGIEAGWGYAGLAKVKKDLEAAGSEVLLVDAGDHAQGDMIGTLSKGEYIIDIMNYVGYDLAIPGNHEFDYTMDQFFALVEQADFPYISANFMNYVSGEPTTPIFDAYKIFEAGGRKIAFVGLSTPETLTKSTPTYFMNEEQTAYIYGFCQDYTGEGVYTAAQNAIDAAKEEGADYVIIIGHMGIDEQSAPWRSTDVIANISGVDAFIDGHSHSVINAVVQDKNGNEVLHGQTGTKLANIGKLTIAIDGSISMEILPVPETVEKDADTDEYIQTIKAQYTELTEAVVAHTDHVLTTNDPVTGNRIVRMRETNLGDLCADAYMNVLNADVAFVNGGGIRANIPVGDITFGQIISVHPYSNMACLVEVTGQQILDALEMGSRIVSYDSETGALYGENGGFLQVAGLTYEIHTYLPANVSLDESKTWIGTAGLDEYRVKNVKVLNKDTGRYEPLNLTKKYKLASHNYMLKQRGDGMGMFGEGKMTILADEVLIDNQVLINYIQTMPENEQGLHTVTGYENPYGEGRIRIFKEKTGDTIVLFTNDVHCQIDSKARTYNDNGSVKDAGSWGYGRVAGLKKELEEAGNEVILVDAGDHIQGGPIGSLTRGEAIIDIMNAVGYDLAIPGNHEFDYGMDQLFALMEQANYPYLSANFMDLEADAPKLDAYKIIEANGKKIAFVGLSTPESITKSTPTYFMNEDNTAYIYGFCQDETGAGVYAAAQNAIDAAKAEGADYVIVIGHMGIDEQSSPWMSTEVIPNISGADVFIDGHSHSVINNEVADKDGHAVLHGQTGTKLENIGKLTIKADGTMTMEMLLNENATVVPALEAQATIDVINEEFAAILKTVVASTDHVLTINDPDTGNRAVRKQETNLGDLCADAYRDMYDSDIAFVNGGGVRANIAVGNITFGNIIDVHPFCNSAVLAEVTGQQILDALEMGSRAYPGENGGFLQVSGLKYEIHSYITPNCVVDSDKMWTGPVDPALPYRVQNVKVLNKENGEYEPLDLAKKYTLASHNYMLLDMGDGFAMFGRQNITLIEDSGKLDNQVLIDYIQSMPDTDGDGIHEVTGYTDPKGEGRITIVNEKRAVFYGEHVMSSDVVEDVDNEDLYRYDVKVKGIDPETAVVGMQVFLRYDTQALSFVKATTTLDGDTGINEKDGLVSFAWVSSDDGITVADETVVVSLYFRLEKPLMDGEATAFTFAESENGETSGYSFVSGDTVTESENVFTENGSITFRASIGMTVYGTDVNSLDIMVAEDGTRLYRYDIRVKDMPEAGLRIDSAQISLSYDKPLVFYRADGPLDWTARVKSGKVMLVWASDTPVKLHNGDILLTVYFTAPLASGEVANVKFTMNAQNTVSAMSFIYGGAVVEVDLNTVDGSITFAELTLGDANLDGRASASDAALILRSLVGLNELTIHGALNADVDGNTEVTAADAAIILRYIVKLIDRFPIEETQAP